MKVSENFKSQYVNYLKSYLPQEIIGNHHFQTVVYSALDELVELSTAEVCEARKNGLGLKCDPSDLAERNLKLPDGQEFIAGARFKNLDINFPFVEIYLSKELTSDILVEIQKVIQVEFKNLCPKGMKFKARPNAHLKLEKWAHTVFGEIAKVEIPIMPTEMNFSFAQNLDWHQQYTIEYRQRLEEKKELNGFVRIGQLDEFQESAAHEALLVLNDAKGFCGVIAGIKSPLYGLPAIYMIESYLSKRWLGKKVAPAAHAIFLNKMSSRHKYVWGTIYDRNLSSLKTAQRIGRRIIETEYFYPFNADERL